MTAADLRAVIDTNVVVSAVLLPHSTPRQVFDAVTIQGRLLVSATTVAELNDVLRRPKFVKYISEANRLAFLAALIRHAELVDVTEVVDVCRDPKDNKFLELAAAGRATHLVTGDTDLLALHPFRGTDIVTPQHFLASLES